MKLSLISATSVFALLAASGVSTQAGVLAPPSGQGKIYDLVHENETSSVGGEATVTGQDAMASAIAALDATTINLQQASFTGPVDRSAAAGDAFPVVPLGAAPGTPPDNDFATQFAGAWHWNTWQRALAIGLARIAPLIGTIGNGASDGRPGSTVFVAEASQTGFSDSNSGRSRRGSSAAETGTVSSTSTVTMTVAGANARQRAGSGFSVAADNNARQAQASEPAPASVAPPDPTISYQYAPQPNPATKSNLAAASFSDAVTASGAAALASQPVRPAKPHTGHAAAIDGRLIDVTQPIEGDAGGTEVDGTRSFISASVAANPSATAARYVVSVIDAAAGIQVGQTVEAFPIGSVAGARTQSGSSTSVAVPLEGKIMAGAGPLDNSLSLP